MNISLFIIRTLVMANFFGFLVMNFIYTSMLLTGYFKPLDFVKKHVLSYFFLLLIVTENGRNKLAP